MILNKIRKCRLKSFDTEIGRYKEDYYMRGYLTFEIRILGIIKYYKKIVYDVTMFNDFKSYKNYWQEMVDNKNLVNFSIIKDNKIF